MLYIRNNLLVVYQTAERVIGNHFTAQKVSIDNCITDGKFVIPLKKTGVCPFKIKAMFELGVPEDLLHIQVNTSFVIDRHGNYWYVSSYLGDSKVEISVCSVNENKDGYIHVTDCGDTTRVNDQVEALLLLGKSDKYIFDKLAEIPIPTSCKPIIINLTDIHTKLNPETEKVDM